MNACKNTMNKKTLAVCGPSWFASSKHMPGQSWPEQFCKNYNWNLISLAIGGCTNFAIALQIDQAIKLKVDFIVVGSATWDRIDIPIQQTATRSYEKIKELFTHDYWTSNQPYSYLKKLGLSNIQHNKNDLSSDNSWVLPTPTIHSNSLNTLAFKSYLGSKILTRTQSQAVKDYTAELYDSGLRYQIDCWIISDACRRLIDSRIPFLLFTDPLYTAREQDFSVDIDWLPTKNKITIDQCDYQSGPESKTPTLFHYCPEITAPMISSYVHDRILKF
jgi:hypothetical protein